MNPAKDIGLITFKDEFPEILTIYSTKDSTDIVSDLKLLNTEGKISLEISREKSLEIFKENKIFSKLKMTPLFSTLGSVYFSDTEAISETVLNSEVNPIKISENEKVNNLSQYVGSIGFVILPLFEVASIGASALSIDTSGTLLTYVLFIKTLVEFRYINTFFGEILETFMEGLGQRIEIRSVQEHNNKILNQTGTKGKFTVYKRPITSFPHLHYRVLIYLASWILKIIFRVVIYTVRKTNYIPYWLFYTIYYHQKIHFSLFSIFLNNGVIMTATTILFMKRLPDSLFLRADYILAIVCTLLYVVDFFDLFLTTVMFSRSYSSKAEYQKMVKDFEENKSRVIGELESEYSKSEVEVASISKLKRPIAK